MYLIVCPYNFLYKYVAKENYNLVNFLLNHNFKLLDIENHQFTESFKSLCDKNNINVSDIKLVLFFEIYYNFVANECNKYNFKKLYVVGDLHNPKRIQNGSYNCDILFANYDYLLHNYLDLNKIKKHVFLPHSAISDFYDVSFNYNPINKILVSGALNKDVYPMRDYLLSLKNKNIDYFKHPGYRSQTENCKYYASELNKYICCFTDCAKDYLLLKFFEIPATGTLLLCEVNDVIKPILIDMGFIDMVNCIFCIKDNILDKINFILDVNNIELINKIRYNGYTLIKDKHKVEDRAKIILDYIS